MKKGAAFFRKETPCLEMNKALTSRDEESLLLYRG